MPSLRANVHAYSGVAVCLQYTDANERTCDLLHFNGHPSLSINLRHTRDQQARLTPTMAAEWSWILDHFARHHRLPLLSTPEPEPLAYI